MKKPLYEKLQLEEDKELIIEKLGISEKEFIDILGLPIKLFRDYPSYYPILRTILSFWKKC